LKEEPSDILATIREFEAAGGVCLGRYAGRADLWLINGQLVLVELERRTEKE